jgi:hypothetical protein
MSSKNFTLGGEKMTFVTLKGSKNYTREQVEISVRFCFYFSLNGRTKKAHPFSGTLKK